MLQIVFEGESYLVSEQQPSQGEKDLGACLHGGSESEIDSSSSSNKVLRVESSDLLVYLVLKDNEEYEKRDKLIDRDSDSYSLSSCPDLPTTVRVPEATSGEEQLSEAAGAQDIVLSSLRGWRDEGAEVPHELVTLNGEDACSCRHGGNKTCLFVHGIGVREDVGVQDDFHDYWGKQIASSLSCCSVVKFTHFNTVDPPWYSRAVSREICRAAIAVSRNETYKVSQSNHSSFLAPSRSRGKLKDMVIIAHSTGNLHLASAFLHGDCHLDKVSSRWLAIQGPMMGTNTANRVIDECQQPNSTWDDLVKKVLVEFQLCPTTSSTKSLTLQGTKAAGSCLDSLYKKAGKLFRDEVDAVMCGVSPVGIVSSSSPRFVALSKFSNHSSPLNDGAVEFESCRGGIDANEFESSFRSQFYKAEINHDDGRLINGDGVLGETRKPLKWLQCQF